MKISTCEIRTVCKEFALFNLHVSLPNEPDISDHIFVYINQCNKFYSGNLRRAQRFIELIITDEKMKLKVQIEDGFIYIMN